MPSSENDDNADCVARVRLPAVAGRFYPDDRESLARDVDALISSAAARISALACMVPHAGYMYSGHVAGAVYSRIEPATRLLILGPNHTGAGEPLAINATGAWRTPLRDARIDAQLARELMRAFPFACRPFGDMRIHSSSRSRVFCRCDSDFSSCCSRVLFCSSHDE